VSSIPRRHAAAQAQARTNEHPEALRLATQLTPLQRHLVARAGVSRWFRLAAPWQPAPGRQEAVAKALSSAEYRVLEPVPEYLGAYRLTPLGELVAGVWMLAAITLP
jgi:hypothetical protein